MSRVREEAEKYKEKLQTERDQFLLQQTTNTDAQIERLRQEAEGYRQWADSEVLRIKEETEQYKSNLKIESDTFLEQKKVDIDAQIAQMRSEVDNHARWANSEVNRIQQQAEKYRVDVDAESVRQREASKSEFERLQEEIRLRFADVLDLDAEKSKVQSIIDTLQSTRGDIAADIKSLNQSIRTLNKEMRDLEESHALHSLAFYESRYDFASAPAYAAQLDVIRGKQKQILKNKLAATCETEWQVNGSRQKAN